ncbi:ribose 5-phosphate isomerase A [Catenisphaera adipataccumulans]|jgi:ribose 5-phosphate isomerase A|uniref:Ribose 5-phosphate isomerase A n=1 Tax=Catenisphaera adipataccumulans TaxID=700500 RepID=A0A7W8FW22_9FIRM|nr:ribose 5-phosphate isomerase A [Catenisphaera adipataccumulans]MBB5182816.1 ribose 5-phosphate isomerase A [Catenisphaera adipataccumulans]
MSAKKRCAQKALTLIPDHSVIGLGGGQTVSYLVDDLASSGLDVQVVTPSMNTAWHCKEAGLQVLPTWMVDHVDAAFDGCDEVDYDYNALKSGGAIHTDEKIIASMADRYIVLVDPGKVSETLSFRHPVVLEVIQEAYSIVLRRVKELGGRPEVRRSKNKDGFLRSDHGNLILDVQFPQPDDISALDWELNHIYGVVDTSLVVGLINGVMIAKENEVVWMDQGGKEHVI